jgi:hypothetical protein
MNISHCDFTNELDNKISMVAFEDRNGITIIAHGPTTTVEHTWTRKEASVLIGLLNNIGVKPDRKIRRSIKK